MIDYHIHTSFSQDSKADVLAMCSAALQKGIKHMAITDHIDLDYDPATGEVSKWDIDDIDGENGYINSIKKAQAIFPSIDIALGIEIGYTPESYDFISQRVKDINPDFVIGSIHNVGGISTYISEYYEGKSKNQAFNEYLEAIFHSVVPLSKIANVIGHIGFVSKAFGIPYDDVNLFLRQLKKYNYEYFKNCNR